MVAGSGEAFVVAHRAANSVDGVAAATALGAAIAECDVHLFWGRLEVRHLKTVGPIPILWDRWFVANPLQRRLRLEELLAASGGHHLMLDLKGVRGAVGARVRSLLIDRREPITVCSRNWRALRPLVGLTHVRVVHSVGSRRQLRRLLARFGPDELTGISIHADLLSAALVAELRVRSPVVMSWPVVSRAQADRLLAWGVQGLITERVRAIAAAEPAGDAIR